MLIFQVLDHFKIETRDPDAPPSTGKPVDQRAPERPIHGWAARPRLQGLETLWLTTWGQWKTTTRVVPPPLVINMAYNPIKYMDIPK